MRVVPRKPVKVPPAVQDAIDLVTKADGEGAFLEALKAFQWKEEFQCRSDLGDFNHWIELFNLFDDWLARHAECNLHTLHFEDAEKRVFPADTCLEVLRVSQSILAKCSSKLAYGSLDYLANLLASTSMDVVFAALDTLVKLSRKSQPTARWHHGNKELSNRLFSLVHGWGNSAAGSTMFGSISSAKGELEEEAHELCFEFFREKEYNGSPRGHQVIHFPSLHKCEDSSHELCEELVGKYGVPLKLRFALLNRIRIARSLGTVEGRKQCVKLRLMAFRMLFQTNPDHNELSSLLSNEPGLVEDFLNIMYDAEDGNMRVLAVKALTSMCCDRSRQSMFVQLLNSTEQRRKFVSFLKDVFDSTSSDHSSVSELLESLLSLLTALSVSTSGCRMIAQFGAVQVFLDLIDKTPGPKIEIVSSVVRILESLLDHDSNVMAAFREHEVLRIMIYRLQRELGINQNQSNTGSIGPSTSQNSQDKEAGKAIPQPDLGLESAGKDLKKRSLIKSLLRAIAVIFYNQNGEWTNNRLSFEGNSAALLMCLRAIFMQAKHLGSTSFALASTVMGDLLHFDPTRFSAIQEFALPEAFLSAVHDGVLVTSDTICNFPAALVALCLNKEGLKQVVASNVLDCLVPVFTSQEYLRALHGETAPMLGNGLDELVRHVPEMKNKCVDMLFDIMKKIIQIGRDNDKENGGEEGSSLKDAGAQSMETDNDSHDAQTSPAAESVDTNASVSLSGEHGDITGQLVCNVSRLLESVLATPAMSEAFVERGGITVLLQLPLKSTSGPGNHLFGAFRSLHQNFPLSVSGDIAKAVTGEISRLIDEWPHENMVDMCSYMLEERVDGSGAVKGGKAKSLLNTMRALEGLLSLSVNLLRSFSSMLSGLSMDDSSKLLRLLGCFHCSIMWHTNLFQEVTRRLGSEGTSGKTDGEPLGASKADTDAQKDSPVTSEHGDKPAGGNSKKPKQGEMFETAARLIFSIRQLLHVVSKSCVKQQRVKPNGLTPTNEGFCAAAGLAKLLFDYTSFVDKWCGPTCLQGMQTCSVLPERLRSEDALSSILKASRLCFSAKAIDELGAILVSQRHKNCNPLLMNVFVRGSVLDHLLDVFIEHVQLLENFDAELAIGKNGMEEASKTQRDYLRDLLVKVLSKILFILDTITNPAMLFSSAQSSSWLVAKFPEDSTNAMMSLPLKACKEMEALTTPEEFMFSLHHKVLIVIAAVWNSPRFQALAEFPQQITSKILSIFSNAGQGAKKIESLKPPDRKEKNEFSADEAIVEQILAMGFSRIQATTSLRNVRANDLELAMEWLLNHPEENMEEDEPAKSGDDGGTEEKERDEGSASTSRITQVAVTSAMPSIEQLLTVLFGTLGRHDSNFDTAALTTSFALADVLVCMCSDSSETQSESIEFAVEFLVSFLTSDRDALRKGGPQRQSTKINLEVESGTSSQIFLALHMLLLLGCKCSRIRYAAMEYGVIEQCVGLLGNVSIKARVGQEDETKDGESCSKPGQEIYFTRWVAPLFLLLECYIKMETKMAAETKKIDAKVSKQFAVLNDAKTRHLIAKKAFDVVSSVCSENSSAAEPTVGKECVCASLQIIGTLCRDHAMATNMHRWGIVQQLLSIPSWCDFPSQDFLIFTILRYIVEDPVTLQKAMESQIYAVWQKPRFRSPLGRYAKGVELKALCKFFIPLVSRDKKVFIKALSATCHISKRDGKSIIALREAEGKGLKATPKEATRSHKRSKSSPAGKGLPVLSTSQKGNIPETFSSVVKALVDAIKVTEVDELPSSSKDTERPSEQEILQNKSMKYSCLSLAVLTDFCIHYSACVNCILKMDSGTDVFKYVLTLLPFQSNGRFKDSEPGVLKAKEDNKPAALAERSSYFLVASCFRSIEARRRIIHYITDTLRSLPEYNTAKYSAMDVTKLRAFVDFIDTLLSSDGSRSSSSANMEEKPWSREMVKDMNDAKIIEALVCGLNNVELDHPEAPRSLNAILRPLTTILESVNRLSLAQKSRANEPGDKAKPAGDTNTRSNDGANSEGQSRDGRESDDGATAAGAQDGERPLNVRLLEDVADLYTASLQGQLTRVERELAERGEGLDAGHDDGEMSDVMSFDECSSSTTSSHSDSDTYSGSESYSMTADSEVEEDVDGPYGDTVHTGGIRVVMNDDRMNEDLEEQGGVNHGADHHMHERNYIRVAEVNMDTDGSETHGSDDEHLHDDDVLDEQEERDFHEYHYRGRDDQSEDWSGSDSPVIEVRASSPFQLHDREMMTSDTPAYSLGSLQTGIPLLDTFFGALGVSNGQVTLPRRGNNNDRGNSAMLGIHPLVNPSCWGPESTPSRRLVAAFGEGPHELSPSGRDYRGLFSSNSHLNMFWENELHQSLRMNRRLTSFFGSYGNGGSGGGLCDIWSMEGRNDGFDVFEDSEGPVRSLPPFMPSVFTNTLSSRDRAAGSSNSRDQSQTQLEEGIEQLILSEVPLAKEEEPVQADKKLDPVKEHPKPTTDIPVAKCKNKEAGLSAEEGAPSSTVQHEVIPNEGATTSAGGRDAGRQRDSTSVPASTDGNLESAGRQNCTDGNPSIDPAFLQALPEDLREEVLSSQRGARQAEPQMTPDNQQPESTPQDLDPEFLAALPPEIQFEVLQQQQQAERRSQTRTPPETENVGAEMDMASVLATFPPDVREDVLLTLDESTVAMLPPAILAEVQTLRQRSRPFRSYVHSLNPSRSPFGEDTSYSEVVQRGFRFPRRTNLMGMGRDQAMPGGNQVSESQLKNRSMASKWANRRELLSTSEPPMDAAAVSSILRLLRVSQPLGKGLMQRVLLNLCAHPESCSQVLQCFCDALGCAVQAVGNKPSVATTNLGDNKEHKGPFALYGCQGDVFYERKAGSGVPLLVLRRMLSLLTYLAKNDRQMPVILMTSEYKVKIWADKSGKSVLGSDPRTHITILELLFQLLNSIHVGFKSEADHSSISNMLLNLLNFILSHLASLIPDSGVESRWQGGSGDSKEQKEKDEKAVPDCRSKLESYIQPYFELLSSLLTTHAGNFVKSERIVRNGRIANHLHQIFSVLWDILPRDWTFKLIDCLSAEGQKVVQKCKAEFDDEMKRADPSFCEIVSAMGVLQIVHNVQHLNNLIEKDKCEVSANERKGFDMFCSEARHLWESLDRHAEMLEGMLKDGQKEGSSAPPLPECVLAILPIAEAFALLTLGFEPTAVESTSAQGVKAKSSAESAVEELTFVSFAEKHCALVNALIKHHPSCLHGNLKVLLDYPRLIEFENKCSYFRDKISKDCVNRHLGSLRIGVRRDCVFEDSFHQLRHRTREEIHGRLNVQFQGEEGVDAGGLTREWYQIMARSIFNEELALFTSCGNGATFQPNPNSIVQNEGVDHLQYFRFVGRFVAKALVDGQILDAYFTRSMYKHMLGQSLSYEDIEAVDPDFFKNLKWMLENDIVGVLDLTFTAETDYFDKKDIVDLKEGGSNMPVTNENKAEYVNLVAKHRMTNAIESQINAFLEGFWEIVPKKLLEIFNDNELELLISGLPEIDLKDLKDNTEYVGYSPTSAVVRWFWEVVEEFNKEEKARLVQFCTGTSKVPLEGFKALQGVSGLQKFQIHKSYGKRTLLPTAHTCFNQLDLVEYESKENLKERLSLALHEGSEGFGFI